MKILVTGASGFIGSSLVPFLKEQGETVFRLVRNPQQSAPDAVYWNPLSKEGDFEALNHFDLVINLAGENLMGWWTQTKKRNIRNSRVDRTFSLCDTLATIDHPPKVVISASAVGYYGNQGDRWLSEKDPSGKGFLASVCRDWEMATQPLSERGIRVIIPRIALVLSPKGGLLKRMISAFRWGLGGKLGSGKQYMSWVSLDDLLRLFYFCIKEERLKGPINTAAPEPVTNQAFTQFLGEWLHRPTFMTMPEWALKAFLGEMAEELLLSSIRVSSASIQNLGFSFKDAKLRDLNQGVPISL